jgi:hypothetical protein
MTERLSRSTKPIFADRRFDQSQSLSIRRSGWQADHMQIVARCRPGGSPCLTERMPHSGTKRCKRISIA